jgi:hypothetical protein
MELYNALALPILLFGREIWTLRKKKRIEKTDITVEKKFFRGRARNKWCENKNEEKKIG